MADVMRHRWGEDNPVKARIVTAQAVSIGDMVANSTGFVVPASGETAAVLATAQATFAAHFLGVAMQGKDAGMTTPGHGGGEANMLRVATEGVFEFNTFGTTYGLGDLVGVSYASAGSTLDPQKVELVASIALAIGRVSHPKTAAGPTTVYVRIFSETMLGGVQS